MSSLGAALNSALSSLRANQIGLAVMSNNIANANTPGYTRTRVVMQESPSVGGAFPVGSGVRVIGTEAVRDQLIERRLWNETSGKSDSDLTQQSLSNIETVFNESGNTGLNPLLSNFFNSFQKLSTNPSNSDLRQQITDSAATLTQFINARAGDLQDMKSSIDHSIKDDVSAANALIDQIAVVSRNIQETETSSQPADNLRDQRTNLVKQLSAIMNVKVLDSHGTFQLTAGNNRTLTIGATAVPLTASTSTGGLTTVLSGSSDITSEFTGGTLAARVALRDESIPRYQQALDQMAYDLAAQVNQVHSASFDQDGTSGTNFFTPIASVAGAALNLQVNPVVASDPRKLAASSNVSGTGNEAAIAMGNLLNASNPPRGTVVQQYGALVYQIGSDSANAQLDNSQHDSMLTQLENLRASVSGVSIDEETASIIQFQRAFQASARVVTTIDELLQSTLAMVT